MIAAIFDMDGVIVHTNPHHQIAWERYYERNGKTLTEADFIEHVSGRHNDQILSHLFGDQVISLEEFQQLAAEKEALFRELYAPDITPLPGLLVFLEALRDAEIGTAVGTSAPVENLDFVMDALELRAYFQVLLEASMVSHPKPDPAIYLRAMHELGVQPTDSIVFEDSMTGIRAGRASGAKVIGVATTEPVERLRAVCDDVITDFTEMTIERFRAVLTKPTVRV
jgi:beta-phosphoglucomutase